MHKLKQSHSIVMWHADEIFVKLKGGEFHKSGARIGFVWNIMDRQTRFLLASKLTDERDKKSAIIAFTQALANAHGLKPSEIRADSLNSYNQVVRKQCRMLSISLIVGLRNNMQITIGSSV